MFERFKEMIELASWHIKQMDSALFSFFLLIQKISIFFVDDVLKELMNKRIYIFLIQFKAS